MKKILRGTSLWVALLTFITFTCKNSEKTDSENNDEIKEIAQETIYP